jgi:hypothetical protein
VHGGTEGTEETLRRRLPRDLTALLGVALTLLTLRYVSERRWLLDAHAYWAAWRGPVYDQAPDTLDAYLYSPAFAQAIWPLTQLAWPVFGALWALATVAALVHLFRPLGRGWVVALLLCCTPEILTGNVFWLLALVAVYGHRWPALWAVALLTKVTPGVGLVWFVVRREWRSLGIALGATAAIAAVSFALAPSLWGDWLDLLTSHAGSGAGSSLVPPVWVRLPLATALVAWGASRDRRWTIPAAMVLATPVAGVAALVVLAAVPRLAESRRPQRAVTPVH